MSIDVKEIANLAKVLHENGDTILNGLSKLSINAALLQKIGNEFSSISSSDVVNSGFEVLSAASSQSEDVQQLLFLYDFFQKTGGVKVVNDINFPLSDGMIDISKFRNMKYLELKKVPVKKVTGLKTVQPQLECIICEHGMNALEQLLAECGGDNSTGFVWSELKEAVLSFNDITVLDTSVAFAPWLQVLDLSHNQICDVNSLECLPNLKYVNLSYNSLTAIPKFNKSTRRKLEVLVLKSNYIEDLEGLSGLDRLTELDLSNNWICTFNVFQPFLRMSTLHWLSLKGNPICNMPKYRENVVGFLHINASFGHFTLDNSTLSKKERSRVGLELIPRGFDEDVHQTIINPVASTSTCLEEDAPKYPEKVGRKSGRVRRAPIANLIDGTYEELPDDFGDIFVKEPSTDHITTKNLIETTRDTYGDNWLRCEAANVVQNILGLPQALKSSTPYDDSCLDAFLRETQRNNNPFPPFLTNIVTTTAIIEPIPQDETKQSSQTSNDAFVSCNEESRYTTAEDTNGAAEYSKESSPDIETIQEPNELVEESDSQERLFLVTKISKSGNGVTREEIFFTLSPSELRERSVDNGRIIGSWSIASLESITRIDDLQLQMVFDTIRRDRRERVYEFSPEDSKELEDFLQNDLQARSIADMKPYSCATCSAAYVVEKRSHKIDSSCPFCGSKIVLEEREMPLPSIHDGGTSESKTKCKHVRSASTGVDVAPKTHDMIKCSSQSSIGSAASLEDSNNESADLRGKLTRVKCESDIEIISNPSQSSIEVIDAPQRAQVESAPEHPPHPVNSLFSGLTESSSSGSVTDSVCTAYENSSSMISSGLSKKSIMETSPLIEEPSLEYCTKGSLSGDNFQNMLEEVIENVGARISKPVRSELDKDIDAVEYSYTQFDQLDHRIKLFIYAHILYENSEDLHFLVRCQLLLPGSEQSMSACIVVSNKRFYVLKVTGSEEGEEASKFLTKMDNLSFAMNNLKSWSILPWNFGFSVAYRSGFDRHNEMIILLNDPTWTTNFIQFVSAHRTLLPDSCEWSTTHSTAQSLRLEQCLLSSAEDTTLLNITQFSGARLGEEGAYEFVAEGCVIVTPSNIFLMDSLTWLCSLEKSSIPVSRGAQKLSDLIQVGVTDSNINLQFLQETKGRQEFWCLTFANQSVISTFITVIKTPWEELFSVPLHISDDDISEIGV